MSCLAPNFGHRIFSTELTVLCFFPKPAEKFIRVHDFNPAEGLKRQQVRIAGYDDFHSRSDGAFEDSIILLILLHCIYYLLGLNNVSQFLNLVY